MAGDNDQATTSLERLKGLNVAGPGGVFDTINSGISDVATPGDLGSLKSIDAMTTPDEIDSLKITSFHLLAYETTDGVIDGSTEPADLKSQPQISFAELQKNINNDIKDAFTRALEGIAALSGEDDRTIVGHLAQVRQMTPQQLIDSMNEVLEARGAEKITPFSTTEEIQSIVGLGDLKNFAAKVAQFIHIDPSKLAAVGADGDTWATHSETLANAGASADESITGKKSGGFSGTHNRGGH